MNKQLMKQKIMDFINAAWQWHQTGNGPLTQGIGLEMANLEEEILTGFGLPFMAFQYSEILQFEGFSNENIEQRATALIRRLSKEATAYLLSPIEKDEVILKEAKDKLQDAVEVLPMIGLSTSEYSLFLYYDFYLKDILDETQLLQHLKKAETINEDAVTRIPFTYESLKNGNQVKRLLKAGIPFIKEYKAFLKYKFGNQTWDKQPANASDQENMVKNNALILKHFFITYIAAKYEDTAVVEVLVSRKNGFATLRIWCTASMIQLMLQHAKYYSLSIPPMYVINPRYLKDGEVHLRLKEACSKNVEIENIIVGLKRVDNNDDEKDNLPYYTVAYITPTVTTPAIPLNRYGDGLPF